MVLMIKNDIYKVCTLALCGVCGEFSAHLRTLCKSLNIIICTLTHSFRTSLIVRTHTQKCAEVCEAAILKDFKSVRKCASRARYLLFFLSRRDNKKNSDTKEKVSKGLSTDGKRFALLPTARSLPSVHAL